MPEFAKWDVVFETRRLEKGRDRTPPVPPRDTITGAQIWFQAECIHEDGLKIAKGRLKEEKAPERTRYYRERYRFIQMGSATVDQIARVIWREMWQERSKELSEKPKIVKDTSKEAEVARYQADKRRDGRRPSKSGEGERGICSGREEGCGCAGRCHFARQEDNDTQTAGLLDPGDRKFRVTTPATGDGGTKRGFKVIERTGVLPGSERGTDGQVRCDIASETFAKRQPHVSDRPEPEDESRNEVPEPGVHEVDRRLRTSDRGRGNPKGGRGNVPDTAKPGSKADNTSQLPLW